MLRASPRLCLGPLAACLAAAFAAAPAWGTDNCDNTSGSPNGGFVCGGSNNGAVVSTAVGFYNNATGLQSTAIGYSNGATGDVSLAVGTRNNYDGSTGSFITSGFASSAFGYDNRATGGISTVVGYDNTASGLHSTAMGYRNTASGDNSSVFGAYSTAAGNASSVFGAYSTAAGNASSAMGYANIASGGYSVAVGSESRAQALSSIAIGAADAGGGSGSGAIVHPGADGSVAIGQGATVHANVFGAVAIGQGSVADTPDTISVGASGSERRIVNVKAGSLSITSTDAINGQQLQAVINQLFQSGICSLANGTVTCGSVRMGNNASAAGANAVAVGNGASANYDGAIAIGDGAQIIAPTGGGPTLGAIAIGRGARANADPSLAIGNMADATGQDAVAVGHSATATGNRAVALGYQAQALHDNSVALGYGSVTAAANTVSVGGGPVGNRRISNVADPVDPQDAATKAYVDALVGGGGALAQANAYTDQRHTEALRYAAQGVAASMAAAPQIALAPGETGFGIGMGHYDGQSAIGAGVAHLTREGLQLNLGVAAATGGKTAFRMGLGWKW